MKKYISSKIKNIVLSIVKKYGIRDESVRLIPSLFMSIIEIRFIFGVVYDPRVATI